MLSAPAIIELQDQLTEGWHGADGALGRADLELWLPALATEKKRKNGARNGIGLSGEDDDWLAAVGRQHLANFELWHIEDEARTPGATDAEIADVKRRVDKTNQRRNDLAEQLDRMLLGWLGARGLPKAEAALHSESPGLIVDRLSILALKIYHTREESERQDAPEGHCERCCERLAILEEQRADLAGCLDALWAETLAGTRRFKLYRQLKMYNDPSLNPAVYRKLVKDKV